MYSYSVNQEWESILTILLPLLLTHCSKSMKNYVKCAFKYEAKVTLL